MSANRASATRSPPPPLNQSAGGEDEELNVGDFACSSTTPRWSGPISHTTGRTPELDLERPPPDQFPPSPHSPTPPRSSAYLQTPSRKLSLLPPPPPSAPAATSASRVRGARNIERSDDPAAAFSSMAKRARSGRHLNQGLDRKSTGRSGASLVAADAGDCRLEGTPRTASPRRAAMSSLQGSDSPAGRQRAPGSRPAGGRADAVEGRGVHGSAGRRHRSPARHAQYRDPRRIRGPSPFSRS